MFTQATAGGIHEVLVLSPDHRNAWVDAVRRADRAGHGRHPGPHRGALASVPGLRYSQAIVNSGREAGASIEHPHGQLLGMSFVPRELAEEQAGFARFAGRCLLCTTVDAEEDVGHRVVYADERVLVICPFWSGTPYEMLVIPRAHGPHLHRSPPADLMAVGRALQDGAGPASASVVGDVAYNLVFHSAPYRAPEPYHWHVHVWPKLTTRAGFELGTGVLINIVTPEQAAEAAAAVAAPARWPGRQPTRRRPAAERPPLSPGRGRPRRGRAPGRPSSARRPPRPGGPGRSSPACRATIVPKAPSWTASTAATPNRVASTRSKAVGRAAPLDVARAW